MYKFYKILPNGYEKLVLVTDSTLDAEYHAYINWCRENNMRWKLVNWEGKIKFQG